MVFSSAPVSPQSSYYMKNYIIGFLATIFSLVSAMEVSAQGICFFDEKNDVLLKDPVLAAQVKEMNEAVRRYISNKRSGPSMKTATTLHTIPVVVHVMHTGGAVGTVYNPSDARIHAMIDYLNQVFVGTWPGMEPQQGGVGVTDIQVRFELAKRTPACGSTTGINRVDASSLQDYVTRGLNANTADGVPEVTLKNRSRWDPAGYYNIWIVNKIDGKDGTSGQFVAGYAYLPGYPPELDGTVMLATQVNAGNKVLPHEIGHAFGLHHTFRGSASAAECPSDDDCYMDGDMVCDTDPVSNNVINGVYNFACRTGDNTCTPEPYSRYSVNTEHNMMAYTHCSSLFTEGQKERVLAMMSLPSRAGLVAPANQALIPCEAPAVNFSVEAVTVKEGTGSIYDGCRRYTDYTCNMEIGAAATEDATVTLSVTGSATQGLDYEITTNGDFNLPSVNILFPASSTDPRSFSIRVYDDSNVEGDETVNIHFSVDAGGGTAVKGTDIPTLTLTISDNDELVAPFNGLVTLGTGQANLEELFNATLDKQRAQFLYQAGELTALGLSAGHIGSVAFNITDKLSTRAYAGFTIHAGLTPAAHLGTGAVTPVYGLAPVYTAPAQSVVQGWNTFTFSTPVWWDGLSSLVLEICFDNGVSEASAGKDKIAIYSDGSDGTQSNFIMQSGITCATGYSLIQYLPSGFKPVLRFSMDITGVAVETGLSETSLYAGAGSSEYLYSPENRLMARIFDTDHTLGCVAASVQAAGTTWSPFMGGKRSAKVIGMVPSQNKDIAGYAVSLYFTTDELDGIDPGDIKIAKTSAASLSEANAANTVLETPVVSTIGNNIHVFTASFTGFSTFFLTDAAAVLPITLINFSAEVNADKDVWVKWKTSREKNNAGFDIEVSGDGMNFTMLNSTPSGGDTETGHHYSYLHRRPGNGLHYYRLRQTDLDGKITYSFTVMVKIDNAAHIRIAPVPAGEYVTIYLGKKLQVPVKALICNQVSQQVSETVIPAGASQHMLSVSGLPAGVYFMRMEIDRSLVVLRFVKK